MFSVLLSSPTMPLTLIENFLIIVLSMSTDEQGDYLSRGAWDMPDLIINSTSFLSHVCPVLVWMLSYQVTTQI